MFFFYRIKSADLAPLANDLLILLFTTMDKPRSEENEYFMKGNNCLKPVIRKNTNIKKIYCLIFYTQKEQHDLDMLSCFLNIDKPNAKENIFFDFLKDDIYSV